MFYSSHQLKLFLEKKKISSPIALAIDAKAQFMRNDILHSTITIRKTVNPLKQGSTIINVYTF